MIAIGKDRLDELSSMSERITVNFENLIESPTHSFILEQLQDRCIVANGCFDIIHPGHLSLLATLDTAAYRMKLRPIVAMNSDVSVSRLKGPRRPIVPQESRAALLNNLKWPLTVVIFDDETPQRLMDTLRPKAVIKGAEYPAESVIRWKDSEVISVEMVPRWSTSGIVGDTR